MIPAIISMLFRAASSLKVPGENTCAKYFNPAFSIKQIDTVELFRVKDYIITEPFLMQVFKLMDLHLKTTDPGNPILWLRGIPQSDIIDIIRERVLETRKHNQIIEIN